MFSLSIMAQSYGQIVHYKNDAGISAISSPNNSFCTDSQQVKATLKNFGIKELDSVKIGW